ncbi:MAG: CpXC domain-containing protein [Anaerolineales bacterium]
MPKTQVQCPNCRQPVMADIDQLFDAGADPQAKQRLLSGQANVIRCPSCGYQGALATPIIYHDPAKELLLTYFPHELNVPVMDQERRIAPLLNRVVNSLKQEQRKGYLLKPQQMFTLQSLVEKVLEGEGVTKEMLDAQKKRVELLQRLLTASEESLPEMVTQESETIDSEFFTLLSRMLEAGLSASDEANSTRLGKIQEALLQHTELGKQIKQQADEIEAARHSLEAAGKELTREKLLDLLIEAIGKDIRLNALASMARPGLDYVFFQTLSERIDKAQGDEKEKLGKLRTDLLEITKQIDEQLQAHLQQARRNLEALLDAENSSDLLQQNPGVLDDYLMQVLNQALAESEEKKDTTRRQKLETLVQVIQQLITPGYNPQLLNELLEAPNDDARKQVVAAHKDEITPQFVESLSTMMLQLQDGKDQELSEKVRAAYRLALRVSMEKGIQSPTVEK